MHTVNKNLTRKGLDGVAEVANATETQAKGLDPDLSQNGYGPTHGSGARGCVMASVGTADEPAASGTSDRAAVPSGVSTGIYMVSEMRDGDKSKLRDEGMMKDVVNIVDIIAHILLATDVWEQPEIDKFLVETPDGSEYEWLLVQSEL